MRVFWVLTVLGLSACANGQGISMLPYEKPQGPHNFVLCHGFGCSEKTRVSLTHEEWESVLRSFARKAQGAPAERQKIARAVAALERISTQGAGLKPDRGQARTFEKDQDQMDCLDEAINTTHYLQMIDKAGVLAYHRASEPVHRGYFVDGLYPHNSGAIEEVSTGRIFAVDSYYFNSGAEPGIVPLDIWLAEWRPEGLKRR